MRTGASTDTEAGGRADTAGLAALPPFAGSAVVESTAGLAAGLAGASAGFLTAEPIVFLTGSVEILAVWAVAAGGVLAAAAADVFFSGAFTNVSPLEAA